MLERFSSAVRTRESQSACKLVVGVDIGGKSVKIGLFRTKKGSTLYEQGEVIPYKKQQRISSDITSNELTELIATAVVEVI